MFSELTLPLSRRRKLSVNYARGYGVDYGLQISWAKIWKKYRPFEMRARLRFSEVTATALTIRRLGNMFGKKVHPCLLHFPTQYLHRCYYFRQKCLCSLEKWSFCLPHGRPGRTQRQGRAKDVWLLESFCLCNLFSLGWWTFVFHNWPLEVWPFTFLDNLRAFLSLIWIFWTFWFFFLRNSRKSKKSKMSQFFGRDKSK